MQTKNENGTKRVSCDNLGELITEFKKFRNSKSANERKKYQFGGGIGGDIMCMLNFKTVELPNGNFAVSEIVDSAKIYQENGVDLSLKVAPLDLKEKD